MNSLLSLTPRILRAAPLIGLLLASSQAMATVYKYRVFSPALHAAGTHLPTNTPAPPLPAKGLALFDEDGNRMTSLNFPDTPLDTGSAPQWYVIKNEGTTPFVFGEYPISGGPNFDIDDNFCQGTLQPGESCDGSFTFYPEEAKQYSVNAKANAETLVGGLTFPLKGKGVRIGINQVVVGNYSTFIQKADGSWLASGSNTQGQLGINSFTNQSTFVPVPGLAGATRVVASMNHTFARMANGQWYATGSNQQGQLGLGNNNTSASFVPVTAIANATDVVVALYHTFAKLPNGTWVAAGMYNGRDPTTSFVPVPEIGNALQIAMSSYATFAQLASGEWVVTGSNHYGNLGLDDGYDHPTFTPVPSLSGATQVFATSANSFAHRADGTWAISGSTILGNTARTTWSGSTFVQVPAFNGATEISVGEYSTFAKLENGNWYAVGKNNYGQLGIGNTADTVSFTPVPGLTGATKVLVGETHAFAHMADDTWASSGYNYVGGTALNSTTFTTFTP